MKKISVLFVFVLVLTTVGCAHMRSPAVCCKSSVTPSADVASEYGKSFRHDLFAEANISAKQELAILLNNGLSEKQQEMLVEIWFAVHRLEAENTSKFMELSIALDELMGAKKLDSNKIESLYAQVTAIQQESIKVNTLAINQMRTAVPGEQRRSLRTAGGDLLMMDKVMWCIDFCSGQADALCYGGGDLRCWRKQFLNCAFMCYR